MTVSDLIALLQKQDPKAVVLWNGNTSCVAHAVASGMRCMKVEPLGRGLYSTLGPERKTPAVLIDVDGE